MKGNLVFTVTLKKGQKVVAEVRGVKQIDPRAITVAEVTEDIERTANHIERLTGLRCHILSETVEPETED